MNDQKKSAVATRTVEVLGGLSTIAVLPITDLPKHDVRYIGTTDDRIDVYEQATSGELIGFVDAEDIRMVEGQE